jgi:hypothetical protein
MHARRATTDKEKSVSTLKSSALAAAILAAMAVTHATPALAQSTDGFHTHLVFPVVVDSASFTQRFTLTNPDGNRTMVVEPHFVPGEGSSQAAALTCPQITLQPSQQKEFTSLRELCPALASGSQYGFLRITKVTVSNRIFTAFSRVSNAQGNGFSVEAFPLHTFTSADAVVTGLRRTAASGGAPAFQTNCFIGNLDEITPAGSPVNTAVQYTLTTEAGATLGSGVVNLVPGKLTRLLDVFAAAGAPAGNHDNATITFHEASAGEPGILSFCTVQDNSSFGADFRIAKQELGKSTPYSGIGGQDDTVSRDSLVSAEVAQSGGARSFAIPAGQFTNTHVVYFRHPDWVQCEIIDPNTNVRALPGYGLEMRLVNQYGTGVIAGGANSTGFGKLYLGDKADRNNGANTRYGIQVESNGSNEAANRPYKLHCQSGSGHTLGDLVRYQQPGNQF